MIHGTPYPLFAPAGCSLIVLWAEHYRSYDTYTWTAGPPVSRSGRLYQVAALHRSALLAESDEAQTSIELRNLASGELITRLQSPSASHLSELAFSPDGTRISIAYNGTPEVRVWDLRPLREELRGMGMDWAGPTYPPVIGEAAPKPVHFRVRTNSLPQAVRAG